MLFISRILSFMANSSGAASSSENSGTSGSNIFTETILPWIAKVGDWLMNAIMTALYSVIKFMLRIVDFFQFFIGKLAGLDTWSSKGDVGSTSIGDMDVIFRFMFSKQVITVVAALLGLSIVLLIIFTIIAIVKSDYDAALDEGKDGNKREVLKKTGKALFLLLIVPVVLIFGILSSNAVLSSLNNALKTSPASLGGQIFSASSYEANRYRKYAEGDRRTAIGYGYNVLQHVYAPENAEFALGGMVRIGDENYFVSPRGTMYLSKKVANAEVYTQVPYTDKIASDITIDGNSTYAYRLAGTRTFSTEGQVGFLSESEGVIEVEPNLYLIAGLNGGSGDAYKYLSENGDINSEHAEGKANFGLWELGDMGNGNIISSVYNSWTYNQKVFVDGKKKNGYKSETFENTQTAVLMDFYPLSNPTTKTNGVNIYSNSNWDYDDKFCPIKEEYYVMADFIDYAVEYGIEFYFVNSSNVAIQWDEDSSVGAKGISTKYRGSTKTNGGFEGFVVDYASGNTRYYANSVSNSESDGATFIICIRVGDSYIPVTQQTVGFKSSYLESNYTGPIIAHGVFDEDGLPTIIEEKSGIDINDVAYYDILPSTNVTTGNAIGGFVDGLIGYVEDGDDWILNTSAQAASGVLIPYNTIGNIIGDDSSKTLTNEVFEAKNVSKEQIPTAYADVSSRIPGAINFSHIKIESIYIENGLQYINLNFYRDLGTPEDPNYYFLFSATVIGTATTSDGIYSSDLFASSTVFSVAGKSYSAKPTSFEGVIEYIYFSRGYVDTNFTFDNALKIRWEEISKPRMYFRWKWANRYISSTDVVYNLTAGSASLDYNFDETSGINVRNLFRMGDLNVIILVFASVLLFTVLMQAVWGLISRIYEIIIYFIVYPAVVSTIPIDGDGGRFKNWKDNVIKKVLGAYGVVLGINFFFILAPVIRDATEIFTQDDIPDTISGLSLFGNADFLNRVVYLMFLLVSFTLIKTLPKIISGFVGGEDAYEKGKDVKSSVDSNMKAVSSVVTGKGLIDGMSNAASLAGGFIPGGAFLKKSFDGIKAIKKHVDDKREKAGIKTGDIDEATDKAREELDRLRKEEEDRAGSPAGGGPDGGTGGDVSGGTGTGVGADGSSRATEVPLARPETDATGAASGVDGVPATPEIGGGTVGRAESADTAFGAGRGLAVRLAEMELGISEAKQALAKKGFGFNGGSNDPMERLKEKQRAEKQKQKNEQKEAIDEIKSRKITSDYSKEQKAKDLADMKNSHKVESMRTNLEQRNERNILRRENALNKGKNIASNLNQRLLTRPFARVAVAVTKKFEEKFGNTLVRRQDKRAAKIENKTGRLANRQVFIDNTKQRFKKFKDTVENSAFGAFVKKTGKTLIKPVKTITKPVADKIKKGVESYRKYSEEQLDKTKARYKEATGKELTQTGMFKRFKAWNRTTKVETEKDVKAIGKRFKIAAEESKKSMEKGSNSRIDNALQQFEGMLRRDRFSDLYGMSVAEMSRFVRKNVNEENKNNNRKRRYTEGAKAIRKAEERITQDVLGKLFDEIGKKKTLTEDDKRRIIAQLEQRDLSARKKTRKRLATSDVVSTVKGETTIRGKRRAAGRYSSNEQLLKGKEIIDDAQTQINKTVETANKAIEKARASAEEYRKVRNESKSTAKEIRSARRSLNADVAEASRLRRVVEQQQRMIKRGGSNVESDTPLDEKPDNARAVRKK